VVVDDLNNNFSCDTKISAIDADTGAAVTGQLSAEGVYSVSPDVDTWTDLKGDFPYTVTTAFTKSTKTSSKLIPTKKWVKSQLNWKTVFPAGYSGAQCVFTVTKLTHSKYELLLTTDYSGVVKGPLR